MNTGKHKIKDNITEKDRNLCSLANCLIVYILFYPYLKDSSVRRRTVFYSERMGFEPTVELLPHNLSKIAP